MRRRGVRLTKLSFRSGKMYGKLLSLPLCCFVIWFFVPGSIALAQTQGSESAAGTSTGSNYELSLNGGPILPSRIPGTREVLNGWSARGGIRSGSGLWELENYFAIGSGSRYQSHMLSYRFDLGHDPLLFPFYFALGGQFDFIESDTRDDRKGFGWHYGAGLLIPVAGPIHLRADFRHRFSPGQSLVVTLGIGLSL